MGAFLWWPIWKNRNAVVFNRDNTKINVIIQEAMKWFNMENCAEDLETMPDEIDMLENQDHIWKPPDGQKMKINFNGAAGPRGFSCGAVARDCNARFQGCQNKILTHCTAVEAKGKEALLAVELARKKGVRDIILEGDSPIVINALKYT
ncbi:uncharacterized protein LOC113350860 [Papaver somniferum]|uniref:uncharacterized protein LOC113350860 n=1 Tax=Papaver somniferum TaxID=3469 RepID=UPI000E6FAD4A|nr:uncharacterized protein LOC113350860 [Papaver somniferum]